MISVAIIDVIRYRSTRLIIAPFIDKGKTEVSDRLAVLAPAALALGYTKLSRTLVSVHQLNMN
jgi:hypothetical protein